MLRPHPPDQVELGLEVDIVRQLQMLDEAGGLHIVGMRDHEFLVLRRRGDVLAQFAGAQRAVAQRHRHRLALGLPEHQAIAAGELRRRFGIALELVDHLAFGDADAAERDRKAEFGDVHFDLDFADADFAGEGVRAGIAALGGIAERKQKALVAARQRLQAEVARHRKLQRLAGQVADLAGVVAIGLDQPLMGEQIGDARRPLGVGVARRCGGNFGALGQLRIEQPVGVVEGRSQQLTAGQILEGRRDAAFDLHRRRCRSAWNSRSAAAWCDRHAPERSPRSDRRAPGRWRARRVRCRRASLRPWRGRRRDRAVRRSGRAAAPEPSDRRAGGRRAGRGHWRWRLLRL